jgi:hypothetical protein
MTQDITAMARDAGFNYPSSEKDTDYYKLERFAALVRADERERFYGQDKPAKCSKGCPPKQICDYCQVVAPVRAMILAEREECAKLCETFYNHEAKDCAEAIRARGQA